MKKVNEKRWAMVTTSDAEVQDVGTKAFIEKIVEIHSHWCRIARVQITEIEEGEEDDKG